MKNKLIKSLATASMFLFVVMPALLVAMPSSAAPTVNTGASDFNNTGLSTNVTPTSLIAQIVKFGLGFLSLVAVIIILVGGFKWMTSGGSEDKIGEAKKLIINGVIGLVIILAAWGIANWAISTVLSVTGNT